MRWLDVCRNSGRRLQRLASSIGSSLKNSYDAGAPPASAFVVLSCEPPLRLTTLQVAVTTLSQPTRSVRRTSGFVLVAKGFQESPNSRITGYPSSGLDGICRTSVTNSNSIRDIARRKPLPARPDNPYVPAISQRSLFPKALASKSARSDCSWGSLALMCTNTHGGCKWRFTRNRTAAVLFKR